MRDRRMTPHVTQKKVGSAIDRRMTQHAGYAASLKKRKLVEEIFGQGGEQSDFMRWYPCHCDKMSTL